MSAMTRRLHAPLSARAPQRLRPLSLALLAAFPLGLAAQGVPAPGAVPVPAQTWRVQGSGSAAPTQSGNAKGGTDQVIRQTSQRAVYQWNSFDIGADSSVTFDMALKGAAALNRVVGGDSPSRIFGRLSASNEGQVFLINRNGILFGKGAQVDTGGLVASTLAISDAEFNSGFANALSGGTAAFRWDGRAQDFIDDKAFVRVDAGAHLRTTEGGRVMLFARRVDNAGQISTPGGQTVLAGGAEVYLKLPSDESALYAAERNDKVSTVRGLLVEVGRAGLGRAGDGSATNALGGRIATARGNTTLVGMAVNQMGRISATTSVTENGSVILRAQGAAEPVLGKPRAAESGALVLGAGSEVLISPEAVTDASGAERRTNANAGFVASRIDLAGQSIEMGANARIVAPGATVHLRAENTPTYFARTDQSEADALSAGSPVNRIVLGDGATIDVSGTTDTVESVARHYVTTALLGSNDLAGAPVQKDGLLYQSKVTVDTRGGSPILGDLSGYRASIERGVGEWLSAGGTVNARASGAIVTHANARVDVSGGQVRYTTDTVRETRLIGEDGLVYTLNSAPADLRFTSATDLTRPSGAGHDRWGARTAWGSRGAGRQELGYTEGRAAGQVRLIGSALALQGELRATTVQGERQQRGQDAAAATGTLWLGAVKNGNVDLDSSGYASAVLDHLNISRGGPLLATDFWEHPLQASLRGASGVSIDRLNGSGFGTIAVAADGDVRVAPASGSDRPVLSLGEDGRLVLRSVNGQVALGADVQAASGAVELRSRQGGVSVADGVQVSLAGSWVNQALDGPRTTTATTGGSFSARGAGVTLGQGSVVDVSGGGSVSTAGSASASAAGSIALTDDAITPADHATLVLHGDLRGFSAASSGGGSLSLRTGRVAIGDTAADPVGGESVLTLAPARFSQGGFGSVSVGAVRSLEVQDGTLLAPVRAMWQLPASATTQASGTPIADVALPGRAWNQLPGAVQLSLSVSGDSATREGRLSVGEGARIELQPQARLSLSSSQQLDVNGTLVSHGGSIGLSTQATDPSRPAWLWLGDQARLDVSGQLLQTPTTNGLVQGQVLSGGSIALSAGGVAGSLVVGQGAVLDASGAQATVDRSVLTTAGLRTERSTLSSEGGQISLLANRDLRLGGTLDLHAGGAGVAGGALTVRLRSADEGAADGSRQARDLHLSADTPALPTPTLASLTAVGLGGQASVSAAQVRASGAADLTLGAADRLVIDDSLQLDLARRLQLDTPALAVAAGRQATLSAATVVAGDRLVDRAEGLAGNAPPAAVATTGDARLTLQSRLGTVLQGHLVSQGVGQLTVASAGDLQLQGGNTLSGTRYAGGLATGADLTLRAAQVYPATSQSFTIDASGHTVRIERAGDVPTAPLSADGRLEVRAARIEQAGVLRAPQGTLVLGATESITLAPGSVTSVSADGLTIPFGSTSGGAWKSGVDSSLTLSAGPTKSVALDGPEVSVAQGARIEAQGGGDLVATEFVPGPGGATDVFAGTDGAYAVVPGVHGLAPSDRGFSGAAALGRQIEFGAGAPVPAGVYTLLPARYALQPGAFLVRPVKTPATLALGTAVQQSDGSAVVGARLRDGGTALADASTSSWQVLPQAVARRYSEITRTLASQHFAALAAQDGRSAPESPRDGGSLTVSATRAALQGSVSLQGATAAAGTAAGRGGQAAFVASRIQVDASADAAADDGALHLGADTLNRLQAATVVLGGVAAGRASDGTLQLQTRADEVTLANGSTALTLPDLVVLGRDRVQVAEGSVLQATPATGTQALQVLGSGAALRLSGARGAALGRTLDPAAAATDDPARLVVGRGTTLDAQGGTAVLDSSARQQIAGNARLDAADLTLAAQVVAVGGAPSPQALAIGERLATQLSGATQLTLRAYQHLQLADGSVLGDTALQRLVLDTPRLRVADASGQGATVRAGEVVLTNLSGQAAGGAQSGQGVLHIQASDAQGGSGRILLATGEQAIHGAARVELDASRSIALAGDARLSTAGDLQLTSAGLVASQAGATAVLQAGGEARLVDRAGTLPALADGASLTVQADRLVSDARVVLPSGAVGFSARGDVRVDGGRLDVAGRTRAVGSTTVEQAGGSVQLDSHAGDIRLAQGSTVTVEGGGSATLSAPTGTLELSGRLMGRGSGDAHGATLVLDAAQLPSLNRLADTLAADATDDTTAFGARIALRQRQGDLVLGSGHRLAAQQIELQTDEGGLRVQGTLDARGADGGRLTLAAGSDLQLGADARLLAQARADDGQGGRVWLGSRDGRLQVQTGARIEVAGGHAGEDGHVTLQARRTGAGASGSEVAISSIAGLIGGAERIDVEALRTWEGIERIGTLPDATTLATWQINQDSAAFLGARGVQAEAIASRLAGADTATLDALRVHAAAEVRSSGDLVVDPGGAWTLPADGLVTGAAHVGDTSLVLRAAGALSVPYGVQSGASDFLPGSRASGSLTLTAGADLGAARATAVQRDRSAHLTIGHDGRWALDGNAAAIATSTGDIRLSAAGDVDLRRGRTVVYSTGRSDPSDAAVAARAALGLGDEVFTRGSGDIEIQAGRDVRGRAVVNVDGLGNRDYNFAVSPAQWLASLSLDGHGAWYARPVLLENFQHGVLNLGGGALRVRAGRDIQQLVAGTPDSGHWQDGDRSATRLAGGDLQWQAGRDIVGGLAVAGGRHLQLQAGRDIAWQAQAELGAQVTPGLQVVTATTDAQLIARRDLDLGDLQSSAGVGGVWLAGVSGQDRLRAQALGGDLTVRGVADNDVAGSSYAVTEHLTPARIELLAAAGRIDTAGDGSALRPGVSWVLQPGLQGGLRAVAAGDLALGSVQLNAGRADPTPSRHDLSFTDQLQSSDLHLGDLRRADGQALDPSDRTPVQLVAGQGDLSIRRLTSARSAALEAGRDIVFTGEQASIVQLQPQRLAADGTWQTTAEQLTVQAGRDLRLGNASLWVEGPGSAVLTTGRHADLGQGDRNPESGYTGLVAQGNAQNGLLPAGRGADLQLVIGLRADGADYRAAVRQGLAALGLEGLSGQAGELWALLSGSGSPALGSTTARDFAALAPATQLGRLRQWMGASAFDTALGPLVRAIPGQSGVSDARASAVLATLDGTRQRAAVSTLLAQRLAALDDGRRLDFLQRLAQSDADHRAALQRLATYVSGQTGQAVDGAQALAAFEALPLSRQLPWINGLLVDTVRSAGREAANASGADKVAAYDRAYRAIETVFPSEGRPEADLSLASAQVKTLQSAGITFMVPGGAVDAGRLSGNSALANVQGVVTVAGGDIASISRDDFTVNRSRVFTLAEGDILLWSSQGSIDAGRGAKTVVGAPAPVLRLDRATGRLYLDTSGSFTGSGIAVLSEGSDLDLYAPAGAIDAGEAGIRARGNVYLGAQVIHNAVEFNVGGSVSGASLAAPAVGATVSMANAAGTAANASATTPDDEDERRKRRRSRRQLLLDFLGFGRG